MLQLGPLKLEWTKNPSQNSSQPVPSEESVDYVALSKRIFSQDERTKAIFVGSKPIEDQLRSLLRDQSQNFLTTQLWEVISATLVNEAANLAVKQSGNFEQVQFAKAMDYVETVIRKMLITLAKP